MYDFLRLIKNFTQEIERKDSAFKQEIELFSKAKLKERELLEKEKKSRVQSVNDYYENELSHLREEQKNHENSIKKLKHEISIFDVNFNNFSEDSSDRMNYDKNSFQVNIRKLSEMITHFKSNTSISNDSGLFSKVFKSQNSNRYDNDLINRILFGLKYVGDIDRKYYVEKINELEKTKKIELEKANNQYNQLIQNIHGTSFNGEIKINSDIINEILKRNDIKKKILENNVNSVVYPFYYEFDYSAFNDSIVTEIEEEFNHMIDKSNKILRIPFVQGDDIFFFNYSYQNALLFTILENIQRSFLYNTKIENYDILDFGFNINRNIENNFFKINNILDSKIIRISNNNELLDLVNDNTGRKRVIYIDSNSTSIKEILELLNNVKFNNILLVILNDISKNDNKGEHFKHLNKEIASIYIGSGILLEDYELKFNQVNTDEYVKKIQKEFEEYNERKLINSVKIYKTLKDLNSIINKDTLIDKIRELIKIRNSYFSRQLTFETNGKYDNNGIYIGEYIYNHKFINSQFKMLITGQLSKGINNEKIYLPFFIDPIEEGLNLFINGDEPIDFLKTFILSTLQYLPLNGVEINFYNDFSSKGNLDFFLENKEGLEDIFKFIFDKDEFCDLLSNILKEGRKELEKNIELSNNSLIEINKKNPDKAKKIKYIIIYNYDLIEDPTIENLLTKCLINSEKFGTYFIIHSKSKKYFNDLIKNRYYIDKNCKSVLFDEFNIPIHFKRFLENNESEFLINYKKEIETLKNKSIGFNDIMPKVSELFKSSTQKNILIPVGVSEKGDIQNFVIGDGSYHGLVSGATGSGKTVFLHTLIMSALFRFNSDEINLYLLDFKGGTEFKIYDNYLLPQIKVLALDAMQEFGESILENIISIMEKRSRLFKAAAVSKYSDYIDKGNKLPRILVIIDEFQILYNLASNRKVANNAAELTKRIVTEGRSFGIHLIMSTQSTKILNELSLSSGTMEQMRIRIGLKLTESDSNYMFGIDNSSVALSKMKGPIGTAVYTKEFMEESPNSLRVAYIPTDLQNRYLYYISSNLSSEYKERTLVFEGEKIPDIVELLDRSERVFENTTLFLGEKIRIAPPLSLEYSPRKNNNLLIAGENEKILERLAKSIIFSIAASPKGKLYFVDEETTFINKYNKFLDIYDNNRIKSTSESEEIVEYINEVYSEFIKRKRNKSEGVDITLLIYNIHFSNIIQEILQGSFVENNTSINKNEREFDFFSLANKYLSDEESDDTKDDITDNKLPIKNKLSQIITEGFKYNIYTIISVIDWSFYFDNLFEYRNSFKNKIVYSLPSNDAERFISDIDINQLRENMAIYTDGMREKSQFKPSVISEDIEIKELIIKARRKVYGRE